MFSQNLEPPKVTISVGHIACGGDNNPRDIRMLDTVVPISTMEYPTLNEGYIGAIFPFCKVPPAHAENK